MSNFQSFTPNPNEVFTSAHDCLVDLLNRNIKPYGDNQALNRMLFTQFIAAMEAYLSDTLITAIRTDRRALRRLALNDRDLNKVNLKTSDIAKDEDFLQTHIEKYLRSILYHNLEKVRILYKNALNIEIRPEKDAELDDWAFLHKAVKDRHDCVHRNGFNDDGERNTAFTNDYVLLLSLAIYRLVAHIAEQLNPSSEI